MINSVRHVGIVVSDLDKSKRFWEEVLGFSVYVKLEESGPFIDNVLGLKDVDLTSVKLKADDGCMIELLHFHSHSDKLKWNGTPFSTGITHIALNVDDIDLACEKLLAAGAKIPKKPQTSADGKVKVTYASAPDGVLIELVEERISRSV